MAARHAWLSRAGTNPDHRPLIDAAVESGEEQVAPRAALWRKAIDDPDTFESYELASQIWKTAFYDQMHVSKSHRLIMRLGKRYPALVEEVRRTQESVAEGDYCVGRIAAIASVASLHLDDLAMTTATLALQATALSQNLDFQDREIPRFILGFQAFRAEAMVDAAELFESCLLSGRSTPANAMSGVMLAVCLMRSERPEGAVAALELLASLYPDHPLAASAAASLLGVIERRGGVEEVLIEAYHREHFEGRVPREVVSDPRRGAPKSLASAP